MEALISRKNPKDVVNRSEQIKSKCIVLRTQKFAAVSRTVYVAIIAEQILQFSLLIIETYILQSVLFRQVDYLTADTA
jgi:hypothetical protein